MNTCGTCKFLGHTVDGRTDEELKRDGIARYYICNLIQHQSEWRERRAEQDVGVEPTDAAYVTDASDYHATLCVSEEFGCVKWEARPIE